METLPDPREGARFPKGRRALFILPASYILVRQVSLLSRREQWSGLRRVARAVGTVAVLTRPTFGAPRRAVFLGGDGEQCSKLRSDKAQDGTSCGPRSERARRWRRPALLSPVDLYKKSQICTIAGKFFSFRVLIPYSSCIVSFLRTTSPAVHLAERRLYGYFADDLSSIVCTRNAGVSTLQGYGARSEWRVLDLSNM